MEYGKNGVGSVETHAHSKKRVWLVCGCFLSFGEWMKRYKEGEKKGDNQKEHKDQVIKVMKFDAKERVEG